jgi:hypothetical protein
MNDTIESLQLCWHPFHSQTATYQRHINEDLKILNYSSRFVLLSVLLAAQALVFTPSSFGHDHEKGETATNHCALAKEKLEPVTAKIKIFAPASVVWQVVHEERKHDPDLAYSKVISEGNNEFLLEQKFALLPVIGTSICQMQQKEIPGSRIDYKLIKSDRFKVMEGSWVLIPASDNQSTTLELTTTLDLGMPVPRGFINHVTYKKLERRLHHIKEMAEKECRTAKVAEVKKSVH